MKQSIYKLVFRKMRGYLSQLIGIGLLVIVGVAFFVTLSTIYLSYEEKAELIFTSQNYAGVTFYGRFEDTEVEKVLEQEGIDRTQGRFVQDYKESDVTLRVISLTETINDPYLYAGTYPQSSEECLILKKHADARQLEIGDHVTVNERTLILTGLVASPEYVYLVQNDRAMMAQDERFGVIFVLSDYFDGSMNEIVANGNINTDTADKIGIMIGAERTVLRVDQLNYKLYQEDLKQIRTFAYVFPLIFALLIVMIVFVMLKRTVAKERKQIGVFKALGVEDGKIIFLYVAQIGIIVLISAILGCFGSMLLCDTIIRFFSTMFEVPGLTFTFYPYLWAGIILLSLSICMLSALASVWYVLKPMPSQLLRVRMPSGGRKLLLEHFVFVWRKLSFHTRYSLKSTFRNKGRFLAVTLGMCGSCALLTFSFGFFNSAEHTQKVYFEDFAHYDILIEFDIIPLDVEHPIIKHMDRINKALMIPVEIDDKEYRLVIVEDDFDMQNIETTELKDGIIIPEYYAEKWKVGVGDRLTISEVEAKIVGISTQNFGLSLYTGYDYAKGVIADLPSVYNVILAESDNRAELENWSKEYGFEYSTLEDDKMGFASVMESLNTLIWFMLVCAVILGVTVLYSVGLMNLSAREYEYMFMGVMGYPLKSIMYSHIKETILQLMLAIPSGFLLGCGILNIVKVAFSSDNFVLMAAIYRQSFVLSGTIVVVMAAFIALISMRYIDRLDIVGGLKERDE